MKPIRIDGTQPFINLAHVMASHGLAEKEYTLMVCERATVIIAVPENFSCTGALRLLLAPHARVSWLWQQALIHDVQLARTMTIEAAAGARCDMHLLSHLGAGSLSDTITIAVAGEGSSVSVHAARVMHGNARATLSVRHIHEAKETISSIKVRDVLSESTYAQFHGHAWMKKGVVGSDGLQDHKALLLSDRARCQAYPEIQVCTDQVSCAHGSAIGRLSSEQLAYIEARGLSQSEAQSLLLHAFLSELAPVGGSTIVSEAYARYITGVSV